MLTITRDPLHEVSSMNLTVDPATHHVLPDGMWLTAVKRATRRTDLFLYWHRENRSFVVAVWLYPERRKTIPVCIELEVYKWHPDALDLPIQEMVTRLRMTVKGQVNHYREKLERARARRRAIYEADSDHKKSVVKHLRRKGMDTIAHMMENGRLPFVGPASGGERLAATKERMIDMAREAHSA